MFCVVAWVTPSVACAARAPVHGASQAGTSARAAVAQWTSMPVNVIGTPSTLVWGGFVQPSWIGTV